jgi:hypothetical protein
MSNSEDALSFGLTTADVAWPVVLALCIAIMILPFVFLVFAVLRSDLEEAPDGPD